MKLQIVLTILFAFAVCAESQYIDNSYIVQLKDGSSEAHIEEVIRKIEDHTMTSREEMDITSYSSALPIVFGKFGKETAEMVSGLESVELVEQDEVVTLDMPHETLEEISMDDEYEDVDGTDSDKSDYSDADESDYSDADESDYSDADESDYSDADESEHSDFQDIDEIEEYNSTDLSRARWFWERKRYNLDIIDNKRCRNRLFIPRSYGKGVDIYIIDTGIKYNHKDFRKLYGRGGRAFYGGYDIEPENKGQDRRGHGTYCAGIAGGRYSGVAKKAKLFSIRVLNAKGRGTKTTVMKGMVHAYKRHLTRVGKRGFKGSVMSMSLGGGKSTILNNLVNFIVKRGVTIVTSSGNNGKNACSKSPGSAGMNINVGAHGYISKRCQKPMYTRSNYGKCVHIVAPGIKVLSASMESRSKYTKKTGTSTACPHVAGTVALILQKKKSYSPATIKHKIQMNARNDLSGKKDSTRRLYVCPKLWK